MLCTCRQLPSRCRSRRWETVSAAGAGRRPRRRARSSSDSRSSGWVRSASCGADQLVLGVAEQPGDRRGLVADHEVGVDQRDQVRGVVHQRLEARLALRLRRRHPQFAGPAGGLEPAEQQAGHQRGEDHHEQRLDVGDPPGGVVGSPGAGSAASATAACRRVACGDQHVDVAVERPASVGRRHRARDRVGGALVRRRPRRRRRCPPRSPRPRRRPARAATSTREPASARTLVGRAGRRRPMARHSCASWAEAAASSSASSTSARDRASAWWRSATTLNPMPSAMLKASTTATQRRQDERTRPDSSAGTPATSIPSRYGAHLARLRLRLWDRSPEAPD